MNRCLYLICVFLMATVTGYSQISIDINDMPVAGDTLRISIANNIPENFEKTGIDTTWDFSDLFPLNQQLDSFVAVTETPPEFWFFFVPVVETNLASPRSLGFIPGIPITDAYTFYNKTATTFDDLGYALKIQGLPIPLKYDQPDTYYDLPFTMSGHWSSESATSLNIPTFGYYGVHRTRTNVVDGWGNLITPFGTFQTLRVKSNIILEDTIYIDSIQVGIAIERDITEYKWLGKGQGIPLLTITQEGPAVSATYRDIPRLPITPFSLSLGPDTSVAKGSTIELKATINGGTPPYQVIWSTLDTGKVLTVVVDSTTTFGAIAIDAAFNFVADNKVVTTINPGIDEKQPIHLILYPNPAGDHVTIQIPSSVRAAELTVQTSQGKPVMLRRISSFADAGCDLDISGLASGVYIVRIVSENSIYNGKFIKK